MPPRRPVHWIERPALAEALSSAHAVVALVGPRGSGRSSTLAAWAHRRPDVVWLEAGAPAPRSGALIVDDAERLSPAQWRELGDRVERHPDLRLRLAVRSAAAIPAHWDVETAHDLYLTPDETIALLTAHRSQADPSSVTAMTQGHPAAVRAVARSGARTPDQIRVALAHAGRVLPLRDDTEAVLAVPEHLTRELVARLGGPDDFLAAAERAGLGRWTGELGHEVFALIPPVREAARTRLTMAPADRRRIRADAAQHLLAHGAPHPALMEAVHADRLDIADAAVKAGGMPLLRAHGRVISALLRAVPLMRLHRFPALTFALALVLNARREHRLRALELLALAVVGARMAPARSGDRALMRVVESVGLRVSGTGDGGVAAGRRSARMLTEMSVDERTALGAVLQDMHAHTAISLMYGALDDAAREHFEHASTADPRPGVKLLALGGLALIDVRHGEVTAARLRLEQTLQDPWPADLLDDYAGSLLRIAQAHEAIERFDFTAAEAALGPVWDHADTVEHWPLLAHAHAHIHIGTGRALDGLEVFRMLRRRRSGWQGGTPALQRRLDATESLLLLATGDTAGAGDLLPTNRENPGLQLAAVRIAAVRSDDDRALALLEPVRARRPVDRMTRHVLAAVLLRRLGRPEEAGAEVQRAAAIARVHGVRSPLMLLPHGELRALGELGAGVPEGIPPVSAVPVLSSREHVVLRALARGASEAQIAAELHVSVNTVKSQRRSLYRKLEVSSRPEALAKALALGMLEN